MIILPLYIDPGTGSALFSILIGAAAALYFGIRALSLKLKTVFSGGRILSKTDNSYKYVIYSEGRQYWNLFKPVVEEFEKNKTEIHFLTSSSDDPVFNNSWEYVKFEFIGEGNKAYAYLNFLNAEILLMTTPGLNVYQLKRTKRIKHYSHVLHMTSDATLYRLFGLDYFDSVLLTGDYQGEDIRFLEKKRKTPEKQLVTVGCSYLDTYSEKIKQIPNEDNHIYTVLVSPSWGTSGLLSLYGEELLDPLSLSSLKIIIRPHPQSIMSEKSMLEKLQARYINNQNIIWDFERENIYSLKKADIMISDFSGIMFDYMFLQDKPLLYVSQNFDVRPYDADDLDHELWQFKTIKKAGIELLPQDFSKIAEIINNAKDNETLTAARRSACKEAWFYPGEAGKRIYDFMISTVNKND